MESKKELLKPNEVLAPTLFVGVGGTGGRIVKKVADMCAPEEKENINFLCLDTNVNDLTGIANGRSAIRWVQTSNTQTVGSYLDYDEEARKKWFPKNAVMYDKTVSEGAGQVRAISRLAFNSTIKTGKIRPLYDAIDDLFRKTGKAMKQTMRVVIATTASGGTGSGIALPISMYIRDYVKEKYPNTSLLVRGLLLLPETLDSVIESQTERDSQARNAYATIKEINAFMMKGSGFIDLDDDLKQYANLHVDFPVAGSDRLKSLSLLPMDFCFLMDGQDAEDSTMISTNQYEKQAAQALYEQNVGPMQKKAFSEEDNIIKEMAKPGNYGRNRFGGIGAGVIRYPYEKVVEYVAYDLAMDSIGGEGEATKWTKYDKAVKLYQAEQKKRGIPMSTWDSYGKVFCDTMLNATDAFSKDLVNSYELNDFDSKIEDYMEKFEDAVNQAVLNDSGIKDLYEPAASRATSGFSAEKKISEAVYKIKQYHKKIAEKGKDDNNPIIGKIAARWVEAVFTNERKTLAIEDAYSFEQLIKNVQKEVFHPCATRFALYRLLDKLSERVTSGAENEIKEAEKRIRSFQEKEYDDLKFSKTKIIGIDNLAEVSENEPTLGQKLKGYKKIYDEADTDVPAYFKAIENYRKLVENFAAYQKALEYLKEFSAQFEAFFNTFAAKVKDLNRNQTDLVDELKYQKGDSFINICATESLLKELSKFSLQKIQKETTMLSSDISGGIFDAVKNNAVFNIELKKAGGESIEADRRVNIFDDILMGYFRDSVADKCDDINIDIIGAIELEQRLQERIRLREENDGSEQVFEKVTIEDVKRHIFEVIEKGTRIAAPSIQRMPNEESREIKACAFNKSLLDNRRIRVRDLMPKGEAVDTISKYEIHFFNALYNLTPDKLKKFAAPFKTETGEKKPGTYHRAYVEYSNLIGPDSTKNAAVSTHIDKAWDSIKQMPELDFNYQKQVIMKVHKAFIYGLIHKAIQLRPLSNVANGKNVYAFRNSSNRDEELQVPNGTLCDEFYEILEALYVNYRVVEDINKIASLRKAVSAAKNCNYENTEFFKDMASFDLFALLGSDEKNKNNIYDGTQKSLEELRSEIRKNKEARYKQNKANKELENIEDDGKRYVENPNSILEIPLAFYCSLPNSDRFVAEFDSMVDAVIDVLRGEYTKWEKPEDVKFVLCTRLVDELTLLERNYQFYIDEMHAVPAADNPIMEIIQKKIRDVIMSAPEPEDYELLLDRIAKEFKDSSVI